MNKGSVLLFVMLLLASTQADLATANKNQKFNSTSGCGCHGGAGGVNAVLNGLPSTYTPGGTYSLSVSMSGSPQSGGFNLGVNKGVLSNPSSAAKVASNGLQATHNTWTSTSWTVDWTAPASGAGTAQFNLAVLHGNNGQNTGGDLYGTLSTSVNEAVSTNNPPVANGLTLSPEQPTTTDDLQASYTFVDADDDTESGTVFAWHLNGVEQPAHTSIVLPASATTRGQEWYVVVTPSDGIDAGAPVTSSTVTVLNSAPVVVSIGVSSETPDTSEDVTLQYTSDDADGDPLTTEIRWRLEGGVVETLDGATTLPSVATRPGDVWDAQVRVSDGTTSAAWVTSPVILVGSSNQPPTVSDFSLEPSAPTSSDDLHVTWSSSDPDDDAIVSTELVWLNNGVEVESMNGQTTLPATATTKGEVWSVGVRASDGVAWSAWSNISNVLIGNSAPTVEQCTLISSSFTANEDLVAEIVASDADGDDVSVVNVAWYQNGIHQAEAGTLPTLNTSWLAKGDVWQAVVVVSDGEGTTQATSTSVTVQNAAPDITILWDENSTSLLALAPTVSVVDIDGDVPVSTLTWYKNGFRDASLTNATSVPAQKLAPGQAWTLEVVSSDGENSSGIVQRTFTIPNLAPQARIDLVSSNVWFNEATVLSGTSSIDLDGEIVAYRWTMNEHVALGPQATFLLETDQTVTLTVTDNNGAQHSVELALEVGIGPSVQNMELFYDGEQEVKLMWTWNGPQTSFNILRNDVLIGTTNETTFLDLPPLSGENAYTVQPEDGERVFINGAKTQSIEAAVGDVEVPQPSEISGYVLGGLLLLGTALLQWRLFRGGGRA